MTTDLVAAQEKALDVMEFSAPGLFDDFDLVQAWQKSNTYVFLAVSPTGNVLDNAYIEIRPDNTFSVTQEPLGPGYQAVDMVPMDEYLTAAYNPNQPRDGKGRWTSGGGVASPERLATSHVRSLAEQAIEGGFTFDTSTGTAPTSGYVVALRGTSSIRPARNKKEAARQIVEFLSEPDPPSKMVGGWFDTEHGEIVLDWVSVIEDRDEAVRLGRETNQQAIFDLNTFTEIDTGGTGDRETDGKIPT